MLVRPRADETNPRKAVGESLEMAPGAEVAPEASGSTLGAFFLLGVMKEKRIVESWRSRSAEDKGGGLLRDTIGTIQTDIQTQPPQPPGS